MSLVVDAGKGLRAIRVVGLEERDLCGVSTANCQCVLIRIREASTLLPETAYDHLALLEEGGTIVVDHVYGPQRLSVPHASRVLCGSIPLHGRAGACSVRVVEVCALERVSYVFDMIAGVSLSDMGFVLANRTMVDEYVLKSGFRDVLERATTTDDGEILVRTGALFPVMGLVPWTYIVGVMACGATLDSAWVDGGVVRRIHVAEPVDLCDGNWMSSWPIERIPGRGFDGSCPPLRVPARSAAHENCIRFVYHETLHARPLPMWVFGDDECSEGVVDESPIINPPTNWFG